MYKYDLSRLGHLHVIYFQINDEILYAIQQAVFHHFAVAGLRKKLFYNVSTVTKHSIRLFTISK